MVGGEGGWKEEARLRERLLRRPGKAHEKVARWLPHGEPRDELVEWEFDRVRDTLIATHETPQLPQRSYTAASRPKDR